MNLSNLSRNQKIIIGVVGAVVIGGLVWYFTRKKSEDDVDTIDVDAEDVTNTSGGATSGTAPSKVTAPTINLPNNSYPMGYLSKRDNGKHAVHLNNRPAEGTIKAGDKVKITGTTFDGTYSVSGVWLDANKNVGALYLPISYTPTGNDDRTFQNKGVIQRV